MAEIELSYPGAMLAEVADRLGYSSAANLERILYRYDKSKGTTDGKAAIRRLRPGSRNMEDILRLGDARNAAVDQEHPWYTMSALPQNKAGTNVQHHRRIGA